MSTLAAAGPAELGGDLAAGLAATALALARRIATGATLWCVAPGAPAHAEHLAVEFLHPVIMGKRAVPAVALEGLDVRTRLRTARPGDVLILLGSSDDSELGALARRAGPWGLESVWLVTDGAPGPEADHVLRVDADGDPMVELVLAYHVLWELTHVVFEHPGLVAADAEETEHSEAVCITCADDAQLVEVESVAGDRATVRRGGETVEVAIDLIDGVKPGALLLVHAGVAISHVEEGA
jgi:hydrogenase maturation factor